MPPIAWIILTALISALIFFFYFRTLVNMPMPEQPPSVIHFNKAIFCESCGSIYELTPRTAHGCPTCNKQITSMPLGKILVKKTIEAKGDFAPDFLKGAVVNLCPVGWVGR